MQVTYQGPFRAVDVPSLGLTVASGQTVQVPDATGADLIARDDWTQVPNESTPITEESPAVPEEGSTATNENSEG